MQVTNVELGAVVAMDGPALAGGPCKARVDMDRGPAR